jgi:hypothetical protein
MVPVGKLWLAISADVGETQLIAAPALFAAAQERCSQFDVDLMKAGGEIPHPPTPVGLP